jgi:hypothetical protein
MADVHLRCPTCRLPVRLRPYFSALLLMGCCINYEQLRRHCPCEPTHMETYLNCDPPMSRYLSNCVITHIQNDRRLGTIVKSLDQEPRRGVSICIFASGDARNPMERSEQQIETRCGLYHSNRLQGLAAKRCDSKGGFQDE